MTGATISRYCTETLEWLSEGERGELASALVTIHDIGVALRRLDLRDRPLHLSTFEEEIGLTGAAGSEGIDIPLDAELALEASVGNLLGLVRVLDLYREESPRSVSLADNSDYVTLPDARDLFANRVIPREWVAFFRRLSAQFDRVDEALATFPTDVDNVRALVFHGFLLCMSLVQCFAIIRYARSRARVAGEGAEGQGR
jgi:hypothetical protein